MNRWPLVFLAVSLNLPVLAQNKTHARLILSATTAKPGETLWAGLELKMAPHWHSYWRYSGDAGLPTSVSWTLPPGVSAGQINWPLPEKSILTAGDISLCTYIYEDRVVLLVPLKLDAGLAVGEVKLQAEVSWLECEDKGGCVAGQSIVSDRLEIGLMNKSSADSALIEQWRAKLPRTGAEPHATAQWEPFAPGDTRIVVIDWQSTDSPADFYPYEHQPSDVEGPTERLPAPPGHLRLRKVLKKYEGQWPENLAGILVGKCHSPNPTAVEVNLPLLDPEPASPNSAGAR